MDNEDLMRMRGEQVTLQLERREKVNQFDTERRALQSLVNSLHNTAKAPRDWLPDETARLKRMSALQTEILELDERIAQLKQVSGI